MSVPPPSSVRNALLIYIASEKRLMRHNAAAEIVERHARNAKVDERARAVRFLIQLSVRCPGIHSVEFPPANLRALPSEEEERGGGGGGGGPGPD